MTTVGETYKLAFEKRALFGWLRGAGRLIAGAPFFLGGMMGTQALFGKKPKVERMYIPAEQYRKLVQPQPAPRPQPRQARMERVRLGPDTTPEQAADQLAGAGLRAWGYR